MRRLATEPTFELLIGDVRERLRALPADSVHCVVTSPPYWNLREYGTEPQEWGGDPACRHERFSELPGRKLTGGTGKSTLGAGSGGNRISTEFQTKSQEAQGFVGAATLECEDCGCWRGELGQEPTPQMFVEHLVEVFVEVRRVLRPDGVCFLNIDDTYSSGSMNGQRGATSSVWPNRNQEATHLPSRSTPGIPPGNLCLVPQRLALALQAAGWWVRADLVWEKPDTMPESVTTRPTRSHEYLIMLTKAQRYFWDQEAVKVGTADGRDWSLPGGWRMARNLRSVWGITTDNFPEAHFATMSKEVAERAIKAATSERGCCAKCGAPVARDVERRSVERHELPREHPEYRPARYETGNGNPYDGQGQRFTFTRTKGWKSLCACGVETVPCMVLDPFFGAGTTTVVARRLNRSSIGVELSEEFAEMGRRRMAWWWKDVTPQRVATDDSQMTLESV